MSANCTLAEAPNPTVCAERVSPVNVISTPPCPDVSVILSEPCFPSSAVETDDETAYDDVAAVNELTPA
jgi:hypothetical protein